ncbi:MAG: hypothetical protein Q7K03_09190 [Dehalococcoidia bacterium]|nr:hypothetical protein [Dehalococcoidia bacterium]
MARPDIGEKVREAIAETWAVDTRQSGAKVRDRMLKERKVEVPSLRVVQRELGKIRTTARPSPPEEPLRPWLGSNWPQDAEGADFLLGMNFLFGDVPLGGPITEREAKWLAKLRTVFDPRKCVVEVGEDAALEALNILGMCFATARTYALEEQVSKVLGRPPRYVPMNANVSFRPWQSKEQRELYEAAIEEGLFPSLPSIRDFISSKKAVGSWKPSDEAKLSALQGYINQKQGDPEVVAIAKALTAIRAELAARWFGTPAIVIKQKEA